MYDAPFDTLTRIGWSLAALVVVLFVVRAVRLERAHRAGPGPTVRAGIVWDVLAGTAALALVGVLLALVVTVFG